METPLPARPDVALAKRIIVKIGSRTLAGDRGVYDRLAESVALARAAGRHVVLVSSGAIALGSRKLGFLTRPTEMAKLQASAAAGQSLLMQAYEQAFGSRGMAVAQVLLTHADLAHRVRAHNARQALKALLDAGAVPILNENDSVAVDEIKFGDNDQLAAMVAPLIDADLLVLLSDVDGLSDSKGERIPVVRDVARDALPHVRASTSTVGTGGMASKVESARRATLAGANVVVADARVPNVLDAVLAGTDVGTLFVASARKLAALKYWIAFTLRPQGDVILSRTAAAAVITSDTGVLPESIIGVCGGFAAGDAVRVLDGDGREIGRGLVRCAAVDALTIVGPRKGDFHAATPDPTAIIPHDELIVWERM